MKEFDEKVKKLKDELKCDSLSALKIYDEIVSMAIEKNLDPKKATEIVSDFIKKASPFKKNKLCEASVTMSLSSRILLSRSLSSDITSGFSITSSLSFLYPNSTSKSGRTKKKFEFSNDWHKKEVTHPIAWGNNTNGKLGIGNSTSPSFHKIELEGVIEKVYIGENHTIFKMENGDFYGLGVCSNFLNRFDRLITETPMKLDFLDAKKRTKKGKTSDVELTPNGTIFFDYKPGSDLVIGGDAPVSGKNSRLQKYFKDKKSSETEKFEFHEVFVDNVPIFIDEFDYTFEEKSGKFKPIVWFVCGNRVKLPENCHVHYSENGIVHMCHEMTLYTGNLKIVPEKGNSGGRILMGMLEEVNIEYLVEKFRISDDGKSFIIYAPPRDDPDPPEITCFNNEIHDYTQANEPGLGSDEPFEDIYFDFKDWIEFLKTKEMYDWTGLPSRWGEVFLPWTHALMHITQLNEDGLPKFLVEFLDDDEEEDCYGFLLQEVWSFLYKFSAVKPIVLEEGWSEGDIEERKNKIQKYTDEWFSTVIPQIDRVVASLEKMPQNCEDEIETFQSWMISLMVCNEGDLRRIEDDDTERTIDEPLEPYIRVKNVGEIIKERIEKGDIDGSEERFKLIRVEAILLQYSADHNPFFVFTTLAHIKIAEGNRNLNLSKFIKNGVLNLNEYCVENYEYGNEDKIFSDLVDKFFGTKINYVENLDFMDHLSEHFEPSELYKIETLDDGVCEVPKLFFEIYTSGFDAARRRMAEERGDDPNEFRLDFSKRNLTLLMRSLIDVRELENESVETLLEILEMCRYLLILDIQTDIVRFIVRKAEEKDCKAIEDLFYFHPKEAIDYVTTCHPGILVYWKNLKIRHDFLKILQECATEIREGHFDKFQNPEMPLPLLSNSGFSEEIDENWLEQNYFDKNRDKDVRKDFEKVLKNWKGPNVLTRSRKRALQ